MRTTNPFDEVPTMITLTAIVLAVCFGWGVIKLWNRAAAAVAPKARSESVEQAVAR